MSKSERIGVLKEQFNAGVAEKQKMQDQGVNLYVKNLDDQVSDMRRVYGGDCV